MRSTKKLAFLDRFYKRFCCGAKNHPNGWKKEKHINQKAIRRKLKDDTKRTESEEEEMKTNNSDTVTNGSMFLKTYPDSTTVNVAYDDGVCYVYIDVGGSRTRFTFDWWFASYKTESEEENDNKIQ